MPEILAFFGLAIFIYLTSRRLIWGVGLVIILLPSYLWRLDLWGLPSTFLELMVLALFIIFLINNFRRVNWKFSKPSINLIPVELRYVLIAWLAVSILAVAVNPTLAAVGLWRAYFLEPLFFFLVFIYTIRSKEDLKWIFYSLAILVTGLFLVSVYQYFTSWNLPPAYDLPNVKRLTAVFSYPNALGLLLAPITAWLAGYWLVSKNKRKNWWQLAVGILGVILICLARSEGAITAVGLCLLIFLIFGYLYKVKKYLAWGAVALIIILTPLTPYFQSFTNQIINPRTEMPVTSLEIRSLQWQETWQLLSDNWLTGTGLAGYRQAMAEYHQIPWLEIYLYPHNIILNFWVELGLLGVLVFISLLYFLIYSLRKLFTQKNQLAWPLTLAWITLLIHGLVDVPYFKNDLSILFFIFLGLTVLAINSLEAKPNIEVMSNK